MGRHRLLRTQGWRHALGRRDSPEGLQPAGNPCWGSNSEKSRVEEKTSKNCGRGADRNHDTITHYSNHTLDCCTTMDPAIHAQTLIQKNNLQVNQELVSLCCFNAGPFSERDNQDPNGDITFLQKGPICFIEDIWTLPNSCSKKELLKTISWSNFAFCAPTSSLRLRLCHQIQELLPRWDNQFVLMSRDTPVLWFRWAGGELWAGPGRYLLIMTEGSGYKECLKTHISHTLDRSRVTQILCKDNL